MRPMSPIQSDFIRPSHYGHMCYIVGSSRVNPTQRLRKPCFCLRKVQGKRFFLLNSCKGAHNHAYSLESTLLSCFLFLVTKIQIKSGHNISIIQVKDLTMKHLLLITLAVSCVFSIKVSHHAPSDDYLADFRNAELARHNANRALHGSPAIVLNDTLNAAAQAYADQLASTHTFAHSPAAKSGTYGENLYWGWGYPTLDYQLGAASDSWYSEVQYYDYTTFKSNTPGEAVGHFTAMIWKNVKSVGFGIAEVAEDEGFAVYVVANYSPTPNYIGQYAANVPQPI